MGGEFIRCVLIPCFIEGERWRAGEGASSTMIFFVSGTEIGLNQNENKIKNLSGSED